MTKILIKSDEKHSFESLKIVKTYYFQYYSKYNQSYTLRCIKDLDDQTKFTFTFPIKNKPYSYTTTIYGHDEAKVYIDDIIQNYICE